MYLVTSARVAARLWRPPPDSQYPLPRRPEGRTVAQTLGPEDDDDVATAIAAGLSALGGEWQLTVRALRDRFGRNRLTASGRDEIAGALTRAGIALNPGLEDAGLDDRLVLRLVLRTRRGKLRRAAAHGWKGAVAVLGLLGTLVGLYAFFEERLRDKPVSRLAGDLTVAVAPFTARGAGEAQAQSLARGIRADLGKELDRHARATGVTFGIAPPPHVEPVRTPAAALKAASALNADVLVYGSMQVRAFETIVAPRFSISARILSDAEELVGDEQLGAPIQVAGSVVDSVAARIEARRRLAARGRTLASFAVGLSFFGGHKYDEADQWFRRAEASSAAGGGDVREVILLFRGHSAGRTGALELAERFYAKALEAHPGYPRARFGMAEVRFQRAHRDCERVNADADGLRAAYRGFAHVQASRNEPYGSLLHERALFGRARVLLCLSQAEIEPRWNEAESLFRDVVRRYQAGEHRLRDEASESLGYLGLIALPSRGDKARAPRLRAAATYYQRALRLSRDAEREAVFWSMLGFIHARLGDSTKADDAYKRAIELDSDAADRDRYERARRALGKG
jgi:tetratricopeptide (TPR) repeat protein